MEENTAPQAEAPASAERPSEPESAARPALASFADAIATDVERSEDRSAEHGTPEPKPAPATPPGDVRSGGRRSQAAQANAARIAELERQVAERDPERIRAELAAEQQRQAEQAAQSQLAESEQADAQRYARLRDVPDRDLSDEDYRWREDRKALLSAFPKAQQALSAQARHEVEAGWANIQAHLRSEMEQLASLPGVDRDAFKQEPRLAATGRHLYDAGDRNARNELQPKLDAALEKVRKLEAESRQFRLSGANGLGAARAPINGGRSAAHANGRPDFRTASASSLFEAAIRQANGDE